MYQGKDWLMVKLKKESVQMLHVKNKAVTQVTFDEDYNVPDVKPDIGRLVQRGMYLDSSVIAHPDRRMIDSIL